MLQAQLWANASLWQPRSGSPFFEKAPADEQNGIGRYRGFAVRAVIAPSGRIGLCVDVRSKYVRTEPMAVHLDRQEFRRLKGRRCVYRYGHQWYEIRVEALSDLNVSEEEVQTQAGRVSLLNYMVDKCRKPLPADLAALPHDAAVLRYRNNRGQERAVAAGLCYPVCDNQEEVTRQLHDRAIIPPHEVLERQVLEPAYAMVMLHRTTDRQAREQDALAAMVVRGLRENDIYAAVNHSEMGARYYGKVSGSGGTPRYEIHPRQRRRFSGYLRNVVLNKILLTNNFWPFVLASPLNADVVIGIDVKNQTAGFTVIGKAGASVRTRCHTSRQKEKLLRPQVLTHLTELLRDERCRLGEPLRAVAIHRDGRCWQSEVDGATAAMRKLKTEGVVAEDGTLTILDISKTAPVRLRLFEVQQTHNGRQNVENPQVGTHAILNAVEGFLCSTGRAFPHKGSVQPLHVRYVLDGMPFRDALEDVYALTTLAWTRPEDCSRYPITLKLTDRLLGEEASEFDEDTLRYIGEVEEDEQVQWRA